MADDPNTSESYAHWRAALAAGRDPEKLKLIEVHDREPMCGYYVSTQRAANGTIMRTPILIYDKMVNRQTGEVRRVGLIGYAGKNIPGQPAHSKSSDVEPRSEFWFDLYHWWTSFGSHAISEKLYREVFQTKKWPDLAATDLQQEEAPRASAREAKIGDNNPPPDNPPDPEEKYPEGKLGEIMKAFRTVSMLAQDALKAGIHSQEDADRLTNSRDRMRQLWAEAEVERRAEKKPHDDGAKAVQAKWTPIQDRIKIAGGACETALTSYAKIEKARRDEEEKKAKDEAAVKGESPAVAAARVRMGGAVSGRTSSLKTVRTYAVIDDWDQALEFLKRDALIREAIQAAADVMARTKHAPEGCGYHIEHEEKVT